jgi:hypothetical protein
MAVFRIPTKTFHPTGMPIPRMDLIPEYTKAIPKMFKAIWSVPQKVLSIKKPRGIPSVSPLSTSRKPATMKYTQPCPCLLVLLTTARAMVTIIRRREVKISNVEYSRPFTVLSPW